MSEPTEPTSKPDELNDPLSVTAEEIDAVIADIRNVRSEIIREREQHIMEWTKRIHELDQRIARWQVLLDQRRKQN